MAMTHRGLGAACPHPPRVPQTINIGDDDDEGEDVAEEDMSELQKMERAQKDFDKYVLLSPASYGKAGKEDLLIEARSGFLGRIDSRLSGCSSDVVRIDPYSRTVPATPAATATPTSPTRGQPEAPCEGTLLDPVEPLGDEVMTPDGEEAGPDADSFTPQK